MKQHALNNTLTVLGVVWLLWNSLIPVASADNRVWAKASGTGDWFTAANWDGGLTYPTSGDTVTITNGFVMLTNSTDPLVALTITNASLIFSNWTTALKADTVTVLNNGKFTLPPAFTNNQMSNHVWVICTNFLLSTGGTINVDAMGYANNTGPGKGIDGVGGGGGSYGGKGGRGANGTEGATYGSSNAPIDPGSGGPVYGGSPGYVGSHGGGAVRIEATGSVVVNGTISANGGNLAGPNPSNYGAGASGGAIYITCNTFGGSTNGMLRANGGNGGSVGGAGGGGRIAIDFQDLIDNPGVRCSVNRGSGWYNIDINAPAEKFAAQLGTLYFTNPMLLERARIAWQGIGLHLFNGYVFFQSTNQWSPDSLILSNSTLGIPEGTTWQIASNLMLTATGGVVMAPHTVLNCGGDLRLTNGSSLIVYGGHTNTVYTNGYGALLNISNALVIASNCWIYPFAESTNGGSALIQVGSLTIFKGGGINADGRGYSNDAGPGKGAWGVGSGGGGYGGKGGNGSGGAAGGNPYGSANAPIDPGSGGSLWRTVYHC